MHAKKPINLSPNKTMQLIFCCRLPTQSCSSFQHKFKCFFIIICNYSIQYRFTNCILYGADWTTRWLIKSLHNNFAGDWWLPVAHLIFGFHFQHFSRTNWKFCKYLLTLVSFFEVMSDSHNIINESIASPASNNKRLMAESVTCSFDRLIGRRWSKTIFCTNCNFSFSGRWNFRKIVATFLAPTTSCPWKVHPWPFSKRLVSGFAISWSTAAHLSHKSSLLSATLSSTCKVW